VAGFIDAAWIFCANQRRERVSKTKRSTRFGEPSGGPWCLIEWMIRQRPTRWALVLGLLLLAACLAIWAVQWNSEEYAVYEAAIREAFSGEDVS